MKKKDLIVIILLCVILGAGYFVFLMSQGERKDSIEVYYKKDLIQKIDISKDQTYSFQGDYGVFYLEVKDRQYHAVDVECPNHDCEKVGWVKEGSSKTITCLPNQIYVIQTGSEESLK